MGMTAVAGPSAALAVLQAARAHVPAAELGTQSG